MSVPCWSLAPDSASAGRKRSGCWVSAPAHIRRCPIRAVIPIPATTGNVTVTFGVLSYAGMLRITVVSDPSQMPDVAVLTAALRQELGSAAR